MKIKNISSFVDGVIILLLGLINLSWVIFIKNNYSLIEVIELIIFSSQILFGRYKILKSFVK